MDSGKKALTKKHMFDRVYEHMLELIMTGVIPPGARVKDSEWAEKLGMSRTPVREAIRKLHQDGLLVDLKTSGYEVRKFSLGELRDLYKCRAALEAAAIRETVNARTPEFMAALSKVVSETDKAISEGDISRGFELNTAFHSTIIEACGNQFIKDMIASLQRMIKFYRINSYRAAAESPEKKDIYIERLKIKQAHHRSIHDAVLAGKSELAVKLMTDHVTATVEDLEESIS
ncbi:GntR family transcriptional regulator [Erwinia sp. D4-22]